MGSAREFPLSFESCYCPVSRVQATYVSQSRFYRGHAGCLKVNSPDFGQDPGCVGTLPEVIADGTLLFSDSLVLRICFSVLPLTMSRQCSLVWGERIC